MSAFEDSDSKKNMTEPDKKLNQINTVAFICPNLINASPINALISLAIAFSDYYKVVIIVFGSSSKADNEVTKNLQEYKINLYFLELDKIYLFPFAKRLADLIVEKERVDIAFSFLFKGDILLSSLKGKIIKISSQRDKLYESICISHGRLLAYLAYCVQHFCFKKFNKIVVMSEEMKNYYKGQHPSVSSKLVTIPNFLDEERLKRLSLLNRRYIFSESNPTLMALGSLIKRKRMEWLVSSVYKLIDEGHKINLLIVGGGPFFGSLKQKINSRPEIAKHVLLAGEMQNPYAELRNCDIYVSASLSEGFSRSAMEALYYKKPCLLSNIASHRELSKDSEGVYLYSDYESFKKSIFEIVTTSQSPSLNFRYRQSTGHSAYLCLLDEFVMRSQR